MITHKWHKVLESIEVNKDMVITVKWREWKYKNTQGRFLNIKITIYRDNIQWLEIGEDKNVTEN